MRAPNLKRLIETLFKSTLMVSVVAGQNQTIGLIDYDNLDDSNLVIYLFYFVQTIIKWCNNFTRTIWWMRHLMNIYKQVQMARK